MTDRDDEQGPAISRPSRVAHRTGRKRPRRTLLISVVVLASVGALLLVTAAWLGTRATIVKGELGAANELIPVLKSEISASKAEDATATVEQLRSHTRAAREAVGDPIWTLASVVPGLGPNFSAIAEVARSADDVSTLGIAPLVSVFESLNWESLMPSNTGTSVAALQKASPSVMSAAHAVRVSADRLERIDASNLLPQVAEPLAQAREQLATVTGALDASANAAKVAPGMLGAQEPRNYLLMIQNNAETRATGGIPGALAVISVDKGKLTLGEQSTASDVGIMSPTVTVDAEQKQIYSARLGKFMQDTNLTPDFPTAAATAQAMWQRKTGRMVDGVISIDPVALGYILDATGPIKLSSPELIALASGKLPTQLNGKNVVPTLLSHVYARIEEPRLQDAYFAGVAQEIFAALSSNKGDAEALIRGLTRGTAEGRVLLWSSSADEQEVLAKYSLSGSITGPSISPAQFGVYFNDGTGAKMDYYVNRTVQLVEECTTDGYAQVKVRVTSTNTAPEDAATSLPEYVTGGGVFGVPAGTVQTNILAYGPVQSNVESAVADGKKISFASHTHSGRPVGAVTVALPPGKKSTIDFVFGKIVQHTNPELTVTPTVQAREDVVLDTISETCPAVP